MYPPSGAHNKLKKKKKKKKKKNPRCAQRLKVMASSSTGPLLQAPAQGQENKRVRWLSGTPGALGSQELLVPYTP